MNKAVKQLPLLSACFLILPALITATLVLKYSVDIPVWDQWDTPGQFIIKAFQGQLSFGDLLAQHNESRMFFPKLFLIGLAWLTGWDVRYENLTTFALACLVSYNVYRLGQLTLWSNRFTGIAIALLANLLIFSPIQEQSWLSGLTLTYFVPIACITTCLVINYSKLRVATKVLISGILATISTFSYANGILMWIVVFPILFLSESFSWQELKRRKWLALGWFILMAANLTLYLHGYYKPAHHPSFLSAFSNITLSIRYFLIFLGSPLAFGDIVAAQIIGAIALFLFGFSCLYAVKFCQNQALMYRMAPWLTIGGYTLASAGLVTTARAGFGLRQALETRYTTFSLYLLVVIIHLIAIVLTSSTASHYLFVKRSIAIQTTRFLAITFVTLHILSFFHGTRLMARTQQNLLEGKACVLMINVMPKEKCLTNRMYPAVPPLKLTANRINNLGLLTPPLATSSRLQDIAGATAFSSEQYGQFQELVKDSQGQFVAKGWAVLPDKKRQAQSIILAYEDANGSSIAFNLAKVNKPAQAVAKRFNNRAYSRSGWEKSFSTDLLPPKPVEISAWAFDLETGKAFKLQGSHALPR